MAARLRPRIQEEVRAKIQTVQLINFLQAVATTGKDTGGHDVNPVRIQAAKILLDKTISNAPTEVVNHEGSKFVDLTQSELEELVAAARDLARAGTRNVPAVIEGEPQELH